MDKMSNERLFHFRQTADAVPVVLGSVHAALRALAAGGNDRVARRAVAAALRLAHLATPRQLALADVLVQADWRGGFVAQDGVLPTRPTPLAWRRELTPADIIGYLARIDGWPAPEPSPLGGSFAGRVTQALWAAGFPVDDLGPAEVAATADAAVAALAPVEAVALATVPGAVLEAALALVDRLTGHPDPLQWCPGALR